MELSPRVLLDQDLLWEDEELASLFSKEERSGMHPNLENDPSLADARREAVEWIMGVHAHYAFSALTALLAVNYWDRFMCDFRLQEEKPWMTQLSAVACLSLAAKVEETQVPLLIDFQVRCWKASVLQLFDRTLLRKRRRLICLFLDNVGSVVFMLIFLFRSRTVAPSLRRRTYREWRSWCSRRLIGR